MTGNRGQRMQGFVKDFVLHPVSSGEPSKAFGVTFQLCPLPALWLWSCQESQWGLGLFRGRAKM